MKFQTSKSSILNVFWWRKEWIPKWIIGLGVYPCPTDPNKNNGVFRFSFNEVAMEDSPWVRYDGKVSAGETQELPYTKHVSLVNLELPSNSWSAARKRNVTHLFGVNRKSPQTFRKSFQCWDLFGSTTKLFILGKNLSFTGLALLPGLLQVEPFPPLILTFHVCPCLNFLKLGMVIGYPTFNIFNHQNSTNPEANVHPHPFENRSSPPPQRKYSMVLDLVRRVSCFFDLFCLHRVHLNERDPGSLFFRLCFVGFPASKMKGLEGKGDVDPNISKLRMMKKFSQMIRLTSPKFRCWILILPKNFPSSWVKLGSIPTRSLVEVDLVTFLDPERKTELMIGSQNNHSEKGVVLIQATKKTSPVHLQQFGWEDDLAPWHWVIGWSSL